MRGILCIVQTNPGNGRVFSTHDTFEESAAGAIRQRKGRVTGLVMRHLIQLAVCVFNGIRIRLLNSCQIAKPIGCIFISPLQFALWPFRPTSAIHHNHHYLKYLLICLGLSLHLVQSHPKSGKLPL